MKSLPKTIQVMGQPFKVVVVENLKDTDGSELHGLTDGDKRTIKLCQTSDEESLESTLLHETIHAVLHVSGIAELLDEKLEEGLTRALEHGLGKLYVRRG